MPSSGFAEQKHQGPGGNIIPLVTEAPVEVVSRALHAQGSVARKRENNEASPGPMINSEAFTKFGSSEPGIDAATDAATFSASRKLPRKKATPSHLNVF